MKKCKDCNVEMIEDAKITGQHPFEIGVDGLSNIFISFVNGKKEVTNIFGKTKEKEIRCNKELKARICPKCGKVEFYINMDDLNVK